MSKRKIMGFVAILAGIISLFLMSQIMSIRLRVSHMPELLEKNHIWYFGDQEVNTIYEQHIGNKIIVTGNLVDTAIVAGDVIVIGDDMIDSAADDPQMQSILIDLLSRDVKIILKSGKRDPQDLLIVLTGQNFDRKINAKHAYAPFYSITKPEGELLITGYNFPFFEFGSSREAYVLLDALRQ